MIFHSKSRTVVMSAAIAVLAIVVGLGFGQYQMREGYDRLIEQNEKIIFHLAVLREQITNNLLEGHFDRLSTAGADVEGLNHELSAVLHSPLIPAEYKVTLANQIDLAGIILLLRDLGSGHDIGKIRQLTNELRVLGDRITVYDRLVVSHLKKKFTSYQSLIIGVLALALVGFVNLFVSWHGRIAAPLVELAAQTKALAGGRRQELELVTADEDLARLAGNITDLNANLSRCRQELARLTAAFTSLDDAAIITTNSGTVIMVNQSAIQILEMAAVGAEGKNLAQILPNSPRREELPAFFAHGNAGKAMEINIGGTACTLARSEITAGEETLLLFQIRERRREQAQWEMTVKASRLAAAGELATGIAHEINNSCNCILNHGELLMETLGNNGTATEDTDYLQKIMEEGERIAQVVEQLSLFNGAGATRDAEPLSLDQVVRDSLSLMGQLFKNDGIKVDLDLAVRLPAVRARLSDIQHVLVSVFNNARFALNKKHCGRSEGKRITIRSEAIHSDTGSRVRTVVTDQGGMKDEVVRHLFQPNFTSNDSETPLMGLVIGRELIRNCGGDLQVENASSGQTSVIIDLPAHRDV